MIDLTEYQQERIDLIKHKLKFIEQKPAVACIAHLDTLTLADSSFVELISIAGGASENQFNDPDILIVMLTGYAISQTMQQMDRLLQLPGFSDLKAARNNRVYIADGSFDITDPNQLVTLTEVLGEIINPKQFIFGYEGEKWIKFGLV
ncbi:MAG: ABC transporter substrate-binding protein [Sphingobacteriaceae bacterium]|nr:MAG: ABC transporter substrate-binding protein [Sphingobacteriaceae bacterium]